MIPPSSHPCWQKILLDQRPISSSFVAFNMFVFNMRTKYKQDNSKRAALAEEIYRFVAKYEKAIKGDDLKAYGI